MRFGTRLLVTMALVWSALVATAVATRQSGGTPREPANTSGPLQPPPGVFSAPATVPPPAHGPSGDYVGSAACRRCHEAEHRQWERSLHIKMTKPVAEATIVGNFADGTRLSAHGRSYEFGRKDGKPFVKVAFGDRPPESFTVDYTLGAKRYQGYLSQLPDGRMYVLPGVLAGRERALDRLEGDHAHSGRRARPASDLERELFQLPCDEPGAGVRCRLEAIPHDVDRDGHRLRGVPWPRPGTHRARRCVGGGSREQAGVRHQREQPSGHRHPEDAVPAIGRAASRLRHVRLLPRQQDQCLRRVPAGDRYEDYALPFMLSDGDSRQRSAGRVLARRQAQSLQSQSGADAERMLPGGSDCLHEMPRGPRLAVRALAQGGTSIRAVTAIRSARSAIRSRNASREPGVVSRESEAHRQRPPRRTHSARFSRPKDSERTRFMRRESEGSRCIGCHMSDVNWRMLDAAPRPHVPPAQPRDDRALRRAECLHHLS